MDIISSRKGGGRERERERERGIPVHRRELDVIVCINFHQVAIFHITVKSSDGKVRVKGQLLDGTGVLQHKTDLHH